MDKHCNRTEQKHPKVPSFQGYQRSIKSVFNIDGGEKFTPFPRAIVMELACWARARARRRNGLILNGCYESLKSLNLWTAETYLYERKELRM